MDRSEIEKGKIHVQKLIKSKLTRDDERDIPDYRVKDPMGLIDDYYRDHGYHSNGEERTD